MPRFEIKAISGRERLSNLGGTIVSEGVAALINFNETAQHIVPAPKLWVTGFAVFGLAFLTEAIIGRGIREVKPSTTSTTERRSSGR
jgi:hypothetical protein